MPNVASLLTIYRCARRDAGGYEAWDLLSQKEKVAALYVVMRRLDLAGIVVPADEEIEATAP